MIKTHNTKNECHDKARLNTGISNKREISQCLLIIFKSVVELAMNGTDFLTDESCIKNKLSCHYPLYVLCILFFKARFTSVLGHPRGKLPGDTKLRRSSAYLPY